MSRFESGLIVLHLNLISIVYFILNPFAVVILSISSQHSSTAHGEEQKLANIPSLHCIIGILDISINTTIIGLQSNRPK